MHIGATAPGMSPIRLTRRGRIVVVATISILLLAGLWVGTGQSGVASAGPAVPTERELTWVSVGEGDTLWGIASELTPGRDPRPMVEELVRINELPDNVVRPGMRLYVPRPRYVRP